MENLEIKVSRKTRMVDLPRQFISVEGENLQSKLVFFFIDEFVNGQARLEYEIKGNKNYMLLDKESETYTIPVKNVITKEGQIDMQLVITEGTNEEEIPVFKSNKFYLFCNSSINAVNKAPDGYELWIEKANAKLNEVDNVDIDIKSDDENVYVEITRKDGSKESAIVSGGGGSGTTDYNLLQNKPKLNNIVLEGEKTLDDLNIQPKGSYALKSDIPTKISQLTNDSNYLTSIPTEYVTDEELKDKSYATESFVTNKIAEAQLGGEGGSVDLSGYATKDEVNNKVDKVNGKSLILDTEIERLSKVDNYDDTEIKGLINAKADTSAIPTKVSQLTNDENYLKSETDPTVPSHVKSITEEDIAKWNSGTGGESYTLPIASANTLGGIKIGSNLSIDSNGVLSANGGGTSTSSNSENLKDKNVILIGDSLSITGRWATKFVELSGCNGEVYGNGSAGFVSKGITEPYNGLNFVEMLTSIISSKTEEQKNSVNYIICGGGINDALNSYTQTQVKTNVTEFINLAKTNFPNAKIVVFPIHTFKDLTKLAREKYQTIYDMASNLGVMTTKDFIWWTIADRSYDSGDNVHLTDDGYKILGGKIVSFINGTRNINEKTLNYTLAENVTGNPTLTIRDNVVSLQGVLTYNKTKPQRNTMLMEMSSLYTPSNLVPIHHPCMMYSAGISAFGGIAINSGQVKFGIPETYNGLGTTTIYINATWQIGIDYEVS